MSAFAGRRRRSTIIGGIAAAGVTALAVGLVAIGAVALYTSTDGADASDERPVDTFSATPNGLLAAVDADGRLASAAVITLLPQGAGGSIVVVPVSADGAGGFGDERRPLAETVALEGLEAIEREVEAALRLDLDRADVVDADALAELLAAVGPIGVDLPIDVVDGDGDVVAEAGAQELDPDQAAAVLTARDPSQPATAQYPAAVGVWSAVAEAAGDGIDGVAPSTEPAGSVGELFGRAVAGPLRARGLRSTTFERDENPRDVDVVRLDDAEVALVFGQISPAQVSAPNPSLTFRVLSQFDDAQLEGRDVTRVDVAYSALMRLLFTRGNVISVDTEEATAPEMTTVHIADDSIRRDVEIGARELFGEVEIRLAERRIIGIDVVIELGESYLDVLDRPVAAPAGTAETITTATTITTDMTDATDPTDTTGTTDTTETEG